MGELVSKNYTKPLHVNPLKLSQPMGATLAFLGIKNCMPLMHGAQGCASFTKVLFTRHFKDPIPIQTTAVNDITAVIDGGEISISEAIANIAKKVTPDIVGLFTTGLTEIKGDDIKGVSMLLQEKQKIVYVNTPDFEGGLESGWANAVNSVITQVVEQNSKIDKKKALIVPNVNLTPIEVEKIKESLETLGFDTFALPDLSDSLDGHLGVKQGALSGGGITLNEIKNLGNAGIVITVGESVRKCGEIFKERFSKSCILHVNSLQGLEASDEFYKKIIEYRNDNGVPPHVKRWRSRLQDTLLDTHFVLGKTKVIIADEPDNAYSISRALMEAGCKTRVFISQKSDILKHFACKADVGDFEDLEDEVNEASLLISNFHVERIAHKYKKAFLIRGFPNYEQTGAALRNNVLYEGSCAFLNECANLMVSFEH
ncbi:MAG: nitrogenase iron-molybdenum cofactor biosynthesis protein NifN [Campylobacteraceae bacterium]|jgi:nitrogenase molybdenum-iron protein NifN|nr:nitrogenase iron-molybdenum cofactor biosynthesis protein NifN [Campylobacteraceae bacterium]